MTPHPKPLVIYHGNCADGFTAAWVANMFFAGTTHPPPDEWVVDHHAGVYGQPPPDVAGRVVYIVDFSYPRAVMEQLCDSAHTVVWIDHHASAIAESGDVERENLFKHLSTARSGAYLTWDYFFGGDVEVPELVVRVDDRDRWVFAVPDNKEFHASLFSRPYKLGEWNQLACSCAAAVEEGRAILRKHMKDIHELLDVCMELHYVGEQRVPTVNLPYTSASDACHEMLERCPDAPFAAAWFQRKDGKLVFSLRSRNGSDVDVSLIAKQFGGGGHKHAAGFAVTRWPGPGAW